MLGVRKGNRMTLVAGVLLLVFGVITVRLFQLQVLQHEKWAARAQTETMRQLTIPAKRGEIFAYDGRELVPMVLNEVVWLVFLDPVMVRSGESVKEVLQEVAGAKITADIDDVLAEKENGVRYRVVARGLNFNEATRVKEANLAGVGMTQSVRRTYPNEDLAAQILGFVNMDGFGQYGVEGFWDEKLRGVDGILKTVTDVNNIPLTIGGGSVRTPAVDGQDLALSIDVNVQMMTEKAIREQAEALGAGTQAAAIVMDPRDGRILAMAGYPSFDPRSYWNVTDGRAFNNPVTTNAYEPGSVIKSFTMGVGIDAGVMMPMDRWHNSDSVRVGDATINNLSRGRGSYITFQEALGWSLNTGMVEILRLLGEGRAIGDLKSRNVLYEYFNERFWFGGRYNIGVPVAEGILHRPDGPHGVPVQYAVMTFGQGMSATMLQVASAFSGLVTDGTIRKPWLVANYDRENKGAQRIEEESTRYAVSAETARIMRESLVEARKLWQFSIGGWTLGGKTGTSETIDKDGNYTSETTEGSYVGFGVRDGEEMPRFVVMTHFRKDGMVIGGGEAPIGSFNDIAKFLSGYLRN